MVRRDRPRHMASRALGPREGPREPAAREAAVGDRRARARPLRFTLRVPGGRGRGRRSWRRAPDVPAARVISDAGPPPSPAGPTSASVGEPSDVLRRWSLHGLNQVEFDSIALPQRPEPVTLNGRMMDEAVLLTGFGGDEAETPAFVKPLDGADVAHGSAPGVVAAPTRSASGDPRSK